MPEFTYNLPMQIMNCYKCGIVYAAPLKWSDGKIDHNKRIYCPNGHEQFYCQPEGYGEPKRLKEENERLKRELVQAIHNADQAEASRQEGKPPAEIVLEPELPIGTGNLQQFKEGEQFRCPVCKKLLKTPVRFRGHLVRQHKIEPSSMQPSEDPPTAEGGAAQ